MPALSRPITLPSQQSKKQTQTERQTTATATYNGTCTTNISAPSYPSPFPSPLRMGMGGKKVKVPLARCAASIAFALAAMTTLAATSTSPSSSTDSPLNSIVEGRSGNAVIIRFANAIASDLDDVVVDATAAAASGAGSSSSPSYSNSLKLRSDSLGSSKLKENNSNDEKEAEEDDYDAEFNKGMDALGSQKQQQQQQQQSGENGDEEEENPDEVDYTDATDKNDNDNNDEAEEGVTQKNNDGRRRAPDDNGVLPQLAEQAERLAEQSRQLSENAKIFKGEVSVIGLLPKKLLDTSKRLSVLAAQPAYAQNQLMFNTQAKKLKEQSKRIQDIVFQLHERIPEYALESEKLATQSDGLRGVAEQNVLQGIDPEDPSVLELRREVKALEKEYAKTLRKSQELRRNLKQLTEQAESVNKIAAALPDNGGDRDPSVTSDTEDLIHAGDKARKAAAAAAKKKRRVKSASASVFSGSSSASASSE